MENFSCLSLYCIYGHLNMWPFGATVLLLCLSLVPLHTTMAEACIYNVPHCSCYPGRVVCIDLETFPPLSKDDAVENVTRAAFFFGDVTSVDIDNLPTGLMDLKFSDTPLTNISDNAFDNSATTLTQLSIFGANLKTLPRALLHLTNLRTLRIVDTDIDVWDLDILKHVAKTLTYLDLRQVGLLEWPVWFSNFQSLTTVTLSLEASCSIPNDAFNATSSTLQKLKLTEWNCTQTPEALSMLKNLSDLEIIGTTRNITDGNLGIDTLVSFPLATTLQSLNLTMGLTRIPDLSYMSHLLSLRLETNKISVSTTNVFPVFLEHLSLAYNKLTAVPADISRLSNLSYLTLSTNGITEVNFDMFPKNLTYLDLKYNSLTKITGGNSTQYMHLTTVILSYNPVEKITPTAFKNLVFLTQLEMVNTHLTEFPLALTSLKRLSLLSLQDNTLLCSSPPAKEVMAWYHSYGSHIQIKAYCPNVSNISQYLAFGLPSTTATTGSPTIQNAAGLEACLLCQYLCLFLSLPFITH